MMKTSELIAKLEKILAHSSDLEVLITDGHNAACYRGDYEITMWQEDNGQWCVDIGIGGCLE